MTAGSPAARAAGAGSIEKPAPRRTGLLWLVWRQHGVALAVGLTLLAATAAGLVRTRPFVLRLVAEAPSAHWPVLQTWGEGNWDLAFQAVPLLMAIFVGTNLVGRELADGTAAFAWTQGASRTRWVLGKLAIAAGMLVPAAAAFGLVFGWWYGPFTPSTGYFREHSFALYAPAAAGWMLAGLTLGMAISALTRHPARSDILTVIGWILLHKVLALGSPGTPGSEFWPLQFAELGLLLGVSAALTVTTIALLGGIPSLAGRPRLLHRVAWPGEGSPAALARRLSAAPARLAAGRAALRQHRVALLAVLGVLACAAIILLITGLRLHSESAAARAAFAARVPEYEEPLGARGTGAGGLGLLTLAPFILGGWLGAVVIGQEYENRGAVFGWAQGVSRVRWAAGRLLASGLALTAAAAAVGVLFQWWNQPFTIDRLNDPAFGVYAPVFAGWAAASFAVCAFLGACCRGRAGALIIGLPLLLAGAFVNATFWREGYVAPVTRRTLALPPGAIEMNQFFARPDGRPLPPAVASRAWRVGLGHLAEAARRLDRLHAAMFYVYQPLSRFWSWQWLEAAGLLLVTLAFGAATVLIVRVQEY